MNNAQLGKIFGWGQFVLQTVAQVIANGIPTGPLGWIGLIGSLATAVGIHAAAKTDGSK